MASLTTRPTASKNDFSLIAESFLKEPGLPLAGVLDGESIERVFREEDALFGQDDIYSTPVVLWAFLAQMLREVRFDVKVPGYRTGSLTIVTTLTDPKTYSREDLAELYGFRWNAELDIRQIQQTLHLDHIRCKTPPMVRRELWGTLLAYNRIRQILATAASVRRKQPRQLGFTLACQALLASWLLLATGACRDPHAWSTMLLARLAANEVANRPGRIEPRVLCDRMASGRQCHSYLTPSRFPNLQLHQPSPTGLST